MLILMLQHNLAHLAASTLKVCVARPALDPLRGHKDYFYGNQSSAKERLNDSG
jgi:hypothetical protein